MKISIKKFRVVLSIFVICAALIVGAITAPLNSSHADTKPVANPSYSLKVSGSSNNEFTQSTMIALDFTFNVGANDTIPKGTTVAINVGQSMDLNSLNPGNVPPYVKVATDTNTGTINLTFTEDVTGSAGTIGFRVYAPAKEIGNYTYTANSSLWGNMTFDNPNVKVIERSHNATWGSSYWNTYGVVLPNMSQATFLSSNGTGKYTDPSVGHFTNDGNVIPVVTTINGSNLREINPGFDSLNEYSLAGGSFASMDSAQNSVSQYTNGFYALYSFRPSSGTPLIDPDDFYVYNTVTKKDMTSKFKIIRGSYGRAPGTGNPMSDENGIMGDFTFAITAKEKIPASEATFAIVMPMIYTTPQDNAIMDVKLQNGAVIEFGQRKPIVQNTQHFKVQYDIQPNSTDFIPRMFLDNDNKSVVYGSDKDTLLKEHKGVTAQDVEDGDLTSKIELYDDGGLDTSKPGTYEVTYKVTDSSNNTVYIKVHYIVEHNQKAQVMVKYIDEDTNKEIETADTLTGVYDSDYTTSAKDIVNYDLDSSKLPANASGKYTDEPIIVTYYYRSNGALTFKSAPTALEFGSHDLFANGEKKFGLESKDNDLVVQDTRSLAEQPTWSLTGQLVSEFTGTSTKSILSNVLFFNDGKQELPMGLDTPVEIANHTTDNNQDFNVSSDWGASKGLELKVKGGQARADEYSATVKWTLSDGVANKN